MHSSKIHYSYIFFLLLTISSCGGGGGGGSADAGPPTNPPAALAEITITPDSQDTVFDVGSSISFSWTTQNAVSCSASGDWSGNISLSGSQSFDLTTPKNYSFDISCSNSDNRNTVNSYKVTANYIIEYGYLYVNSSEPIDNRTVYIDDNTNRKKDSYELSAQTDTSGYYEIRGFNNSVCQNYSQLRVENSYLSAPFQSIIFGEPRIPSIITPLTSLYDDSYPIYKGKDHNTDSFFCDNTTMYRKRRALLNSLRTIDYINNDGYSFGDSYIIGGSVFEDLSKFYISAENIITSTVNGFKGRIESEGSSASDWSIIPNYHLTNSNFRIFLNLENYPQSTVDPEYIPSDIDNASVDAFFNFKLIPGNNVPDQNLNGWQDAIDFSANVNISNNSDVLKERDSNCYVNWSSLCIIDFTNMLAGDDYSIPTPYSAIFSMEKETSRGLESIIWEDYLFNDDICGIYADEIIKDDSFETSYLVYKYAMNEVAANYNLSDGYCIEDSGAFKEKWIEASRFFNNGSRFDIDWRETKTIDEALNYQDIVDPRDYDSEDLPPSSISQNRINLFLQLPDIFISSEEDFIGDPDGSLQDTLFNIILGADDDDFYFRFGTKNVNGGYAQLVLEKRFGANSSEYGPWYMRVTCYKSGQVVLDSRDNLSGDIGFDIRSSIILCLDTIDESGLSIFSIDSIHEFENDPNETYSPYTGIRDIIANTSNIKDSKLDKKEILQNNLIDEYYFDTEMYIEN